MFGAIPEYLKNPYATSTVNSQPQVVDLEKEFDHYSFTKCHPEETQAISRLFEQTCFCTTGEEVSLSSLLGSNIHDSRAIACLNKMGFRLLKDPSTGLVLEHDYFQGWLIKKSYGYLKDQNSGVNKRITKIVCSANLPRWMLPPGLRNKPEDEELGIRVANDGINPLRVVILERGANGLKN